MTTKTIRLSSERLAGAGKVLSGLGLDTRTALEMCLAMIERRRGIPFAVVESDDGHLPHIPNAETLAAMEETPTRTFRSAKAVMAHLRRGR